MVVFGFTYFDRSASRSKIISRAVFRSSAVDAAKIIVRCAGALNCRVFFEFEWRNKEGAFRAGKRGIVRN